ncbi:MAG: hypothetical protein NUV84_00920 [Candidatus Uhrbacteria bacterium]|nr:hypothetical protein [Candidatus Uhrbacteria bacterium]
MSCSFNCSLRVIPTRRTSIVADGVEPGSDPRRRGTTMEPLFDNPLSELREAFVRARFAEPNIFGRADIEAWIKGESANEVPSNADTDAWRTLLKHDELVDFIHGTAILLLQKYATTLYDLGYPRHEPTGYNGPALVGGARPILGQEQSRDLPASEFIERAGRVSCPWEDAGEP